MKVIVEINGWRKDFEIPERTSFRGDSIIVIVNSPVPVSFTPIPRIYCKEDTYKVKVYCDGFENGIPVYKN